MEKWKQSDVELVAQKNFKNKAGMLLMANHFCFWKGPKAGMYMKTLELSKKAGILLINKLVSRS
jgi:hypothetical protein